MDGLWGSILKSEENSAKELNKLSNFYEILRTKEDHDQFMENYSDSMSSGTKSKGQRRKRINALIGYCGN